MTCKKITTKSKNNHTTALCIHGKNKSVRVHINSKSAPIYYIEVVGMEKEILCTSFSINVTPDKNIDDILSEVSSYLVSTSSNSNSTIIIRHIESFIKSYFYSVSSIGSPSIIMGRQTFLLKKCNIRNYALKDTESYALFVYAFVKSYIKKRESDNDLKRRIVILGDKDDLVRIRELLISDPDSKSCVDWEINLIDDFTNLQDTIYSSSDVLIIFDLNEFLESNNYSMGDLVTLVSCIKYKEIISLEKVGSFLYDLALQRTNQIVNRSFREIFFKQI